MIEKISNNLKSIQSPLKDNQYKLFQVDALEKNTFYGKNSKNQIVFAINSKNSQVRSSIQKTNKLIFWINAKCSVSSDGNFIEKNMNILTCLSDNKKEIYAFIRLTFAFCIGREQQDENNLHELFTALTHMFANEYRANKIELQGFFSELYVIKYFFQLGINLSEYWQKNEYLNFDFSISQEKKIEVKSTLKSIRLHHFKHEQLLSDLYDIKIISLMLKIDDKGLSLFDLISEVQKIAFKSMGTLIYIEKFIKNISEDELVEMKFDTKFIDNNIHVYSVDNIPRFLDKQPKGVSRTEYDSDLSTSQFIDDEMFVKWLNN